MGSASSRPQLEHPPSRGSDISEDDASPAAAAAYAAADADWPRRRFAFTRESPTGVAG
jgi:hypothetical protein